MARAISGAGYVRGQRRSERSERLPRRKILIADRDDESRELLAMVLRAEGHAVLEAANGFELLDYLSLPWLHRDASEQPDILIMDISMAGASANSVLGGLMDMSATGIVLTGSCRGRELSDKAARLGADAVLEKPFEIDVVRAVVGALIARTRRTVVQVDTLRSNGMAARVELEGDELTERDTIPDDGPPIAALETMSE